MRDILDPQDRWLGAPVGFLASNNKAPVAVDDTLNVTRDSGPVSINVLVNDFDPEGQPVTLVSASAGLGTAVAETNNTVTYTPPAGISGFDTVVYEIADDLDQRRTGQVNVTISAPALAIDVLANNTMVIEAEATALDLTLTQPTPWAGLYQLDIGDLSGGPINLAAPTIMGDFSAGEILTAKGGLWIYDTNEGGSTQSWQWRLNGTDISGATEATYTVQNGDIGQALSLAETQTDAAGQRVAIVQVSSAQTFQPDLDAGLLGWWDASDATSITDETGAVTGWADKTGAGTLSQGNPVLRPTTGTRSLNGLNVIDFDGAQFLWDGVRSLPTSGNMAFHMALVIDSTSNAFEALLSVDATNDFQLDAANAAQFDGQLNATGIGSSSTLTGGPFSGGLIISMIFDRTGTATAEVFIANASRGLTSYTQALDTTVALHLMANRALNARVDGAVAEMALTSTINNRADYHAYLAAKWGLT